MNHENVFSVFSVWSSTDIYVYIRAALLNGRLWANLGRKLFKCLCVRLNENFAPHQFFAFFFLFLLFRTRISHTLFFSFRFPFIFFETTYAFSFSLPAYLESHVSL